MLRQDLKSSNPPEDNANNHDGPSPGSTFQTSETAQRLDIQQSLNVLEEIILDSPRVPFSRRTLIDEDKLLEQLDRIRLNLPTAFQEAIQIVQQRETILGKAEQYAQEMMQAADQEANRRLNDLSIVQQAEAQARQVQQKLQQDCDAMRSHAINEIEQWQQAASQHWQAMNQQTEAECQAMKQEADVYAAQVLHSVEQQLSQMLQVIHNGRRAIVGDTAMPEETAPPTPSPSSSYAARALPQSESGRTRRSLRDSRLPGETRHPRETTRHLRDNRPTQENEA